MSLMTASQLIAHLQEHYSDRPDEILVYTFWDSTDIEIMLSDEDEEVEAKEVWKAISEDAEDSLEDAISDVSDRINDLVQSYLEEK
jgi:hypothetical protein